MSSQESRESRFEDRPEDARHIDTAEAPPTASFSSGPQIAAGGPGPSSGPPDIANCDVPAADETGSRGKDCFAPPEEPCECHCLHCGRTFMSSEIWFQKVINDPQGFEGFWMCPTPNCSGAGFTFDLFPTDPHHPANEGWHYDDDDGCCEEDGSEFNPAAWDEAGDTPADEEADYDPAEPRYKELDELFGDEDDDDLEGEEWKYGLAPGERPVPASDETLSTWEQEQRMYDEPDQRPRMLDWSNREDRKPENNGGFTDEDIPF
jgi:hypothetical protein